MMKTLTRLGSTILALASTLVFAVCASPSFAADTQSGKTIPPGTVINMHNWQQYKQFMTDGLVALFSGKYFWKFPPDFRMAVSPTTVYHNPPQFEKDTEKYASQVEIVPLPDGGHNIKGYVAGIPFPNPKDPLKGWKILVDDWYAYEPVVLCGPDAWGMQQDRFGNRTPTHLIWDNMRTAHASDPGYPINDPRAPGEFLVEYTQLAVPETIKYLTVMTIYYDDLAKPEDLYVFIPALRRSLRMSAAARCAPFANGDWTYDDTHRGCFNGTATMFDADYLGDRKILESLDGSKDLSKMRDMNNYYQPLIFGKPTLETWQVRDAWVIDVHRIPALAKGYCYKRRILYVDKQSYLAQWAEMYDVSNKLWKIDYDPQGMVNVPGVGETWQNSGWGSVYDVQNAHMTWVELNFHANQDCKNVHGVDYTNFSHFFTLSALSQILR